MLELAYQVLSVIVSLILFSSHIQFDKTALEIASDNSNQEIMQILVNAQVGGDLSYICTFNCSAAQEIFATQVPIWKSPVKGLVGTCHQLTLNSYSEAKEDIWSDPQCTMLLCYY